MISPLLGLRKAVMGVLSRPACLLGPVVLLEFRSVPLERAGHVLAWLSADRLSLTVWQCVHGIMLYGRLFRLGIAISL